MRMSTMGSHYALVNTMLRQEAALAKTRMEVSTGERVRTPSDDPVAAGRIIELENQLRAYGQYERNTNAVQTRLSIEEQALSDAGLVLQRVRELALRANSGTLDDESRGAIATELAERVKELEAIANRRDGAGDYMFAGFREGSQPFVRSAGVVGYEGDQGVRELQISPTQFMKAGHSGHAVFMNVTEGNGTFVADNAAANTGAAWITPTAVTGAVDWSGGEWTVRFIDEGNYQIVDASDTEVATGTYESGDTIDFNGMRFTITGGAAAGDEFQLGRATKEDLFTTLDRLVATLRAPTGNDTERAQFNTGINASIAQLDQGIDHLLNVRAEIGARLNALDQVSSARMDIELELESYASSLRDVDWAEAVSRLTLEATALEAARKSYSQFAQLSLFDYL